MKWDPRRLDSEWPFDVMSTEFELHAESTALIVVDILAEAGHNIAMMLTKSRLYEVVHRCWMFSSTMSSSGSGMMIPKALSVPLKSMGSIFIAPNTAVSTRMPGNIAMTKSKAMAAAASLHSCW